MKTAQEILEEQRNRDKQAVEKKRVEVTERLEKFVDEWKGFGYFFTKEELDEKFIDSYLALEIFRKNGFEVKQNPSYETGHLWWKQTHPGKWVISLPRKK